MSEREVCRNRIFIALVLSCLTSVFAEQASEVKPLAWMTFSKQAVQKYEGTGYLWLANQVIDLVIDIKPDGGHRIDLLWGSKNDLRVAEISINDVQQRFEAGGYDGFRWQRINIPQGVKGDQYHLLLQPGQPKAAFLAAVRLVETHSSMDEPLPKATVSGIQIKQKPPHVLYEWSKQLAGEKDSWQRGAIHGRQANEALRRCRKFIDGWLAHSDPITGLIPRNLSASKHFWNGRDSGADNYAFMVLTAALTDQDMYNGRMLDMLRTETKVTSRIGALPADFDFNKQGYRFDKPDLNRLIFDGSEYVKDGLMPISEWLGPTPWSQRMIAIVDSIIEHALVKTTNGTLPSDNVEVNGEMMQVLSRLFFMTDNDSYLEMACTIADYYLLGTHHPTLDISKLGLRDHNCELISGLTEVYAACHSVRKEKAAAYRDPIHKMLDDILEHGVNEHGLMYQVINPRTGEVLNKTIHDNWGYNYNGFYTVYLLDDIKRYRDATVKALSSLKEHYWKFPWQGWGSDGIADSVEGAINLYNREPDVEGVDQWIDDNIARMLLIQKADGVIEGWHGDGNYARTAILWVLMKQQGVTVQPWRDDVRLGAVRDGGKLKLVLGADKPWTGKLIFDQKRHKTIMRLPLDYPRINQFPEWFTVDMDGKYKIAVDGGKSKVYKGSDMTLGIEIRINDKNEKHLIVNEM
jgi:hypothetical protein